MGGGGVGGGVFEALPLQEPPTSGPSTASAPRDWGGPTRGGGASENLAWGEGLG